MNTSIQVMFKSFIRSLVIALVFFGHVKVHAWEFDFSRRQGPARTPASESRSVVSESFFQQGERGESRPFFESIQTSPTSRDIVILHTEEGFVPDTLQLRKDVRYRVRVVNVHPRQKNASFILDSFSEHHATYFGELRSFEIHPRTEGIFAYQSPETGAQGKLVIFSAPGVESRLPASAPGR